MRLENIDLLICPVCKNKLIFGDKKNKDSKIENGFLICNNCKRYYPVAEGVPNFIYDEITSLSQKEFWENEKVLKRRPPSHPVIKAFALPKVNAIKDIIQKTNVISKKISLLDVGCGNGYFSYYFDRYFNVTCLDYSNSILSICPVENKIQASAYNMPLKDNSFEIVFCANLLHHLANPGDVINEMLRVTSRYIVIIEPNKYNPFMYLISIVSETDKLVRKYTTKYLRNLLQDKADIISFKKTGFILPNVTPLLLLPLLKLIEPFMFPKINHLLIAEKKNEKKIPN